MNLFQQTLQKKNHGRPPVWFMRQAGRYHSHYQALRKQHSFMELCKVPELACEVTMGPIQDFDFDAAILFSDLLFPLEAMGMGLQYNEGPSLGWHLNSIDDVKRLKFGREVAEFMDFQGEAIRLIRKRLSTEKGLLGFVGGPLTLFFYAAQGSHQAVIREGGTHSAIEGLRDGRFSAFCEKLTPILVENMLIQARAGIDTVSVMDTAVGEISPEDFKTHVIPQLRRVFDEFRKVAPTVPISYYSKGTGPDYWKHLIDIGISCLGVDWKNDLVQVLRDWTPHFAIQGNIDPEWLFLDPSELETRLRKIFASALELPAECRAAWICGLGHGILPKTPENNVRLFLRLQKEMFR